MKKYLKITVSILVVGLVILGAYFLFRNNPTVQKLVVSVFPASKKTVRGLGEEAGVPAPKLQSLTADPIFDYWINSKTGDVYYLNEAGQVLKKSGEAEATLANSQTVLRLNQITVSFDGTYALAKFNYPNFPTFSVFNTDTNSWQPLPEKTIAAAWSPNAPEIAYLDDKALKTLNITTQKTAEVVKMTQKELFLHWRTDSKILLSAASDSVSKILALNLKNKTLEPFLEEAGVSIQWAKDDRLGIKLNHVNGTNQTSLVDSSGAALSTFTFVTLPSKCAISEDKIYCAIPKDVPERTKLPEDYYKRAVYFDDVFYLIDLETGGYSEVPTENPDLVIDADHLEVYNNTLYFKNRLDNKLYSLNL